ncbi:MAG: DUF5937 family protein [Jatrophihabitans sp.]
MLSLTFSAQDVANTRLGFSALQEAVFSLLALKDPGQHAIHLKWLKQARLDLDQAGLDISPITDLILPPGWSIPDFLTPPPAGPMPDFDDELNELAKTDHEQVRADLRTLNGPWPPIAHQLYDDPQQGLDVICRFLSDYWQLTLAPFWPAMRSVLEGDVLYRASQLARGGAAQLFSDLAPTVRWDEHRLQVAHRGLSGLVSLDGAGLLLVPSIFVWPAVFTTTAIGWQPTMVYPARASGNLWNASRAKSVSALAAVIGSARGRLLLELGAPASGSDLALRVGLSPGGASQQLTLLRAAGLVTSHRIGRVVLFSRTALGDELVSEISDLR